MFLSDAMGGFTGTKRGKSKPKRQSFVDEVINGKRGAARPKRRAKAKARRPQQSFNDLVMNGPRRPKQAKPSKKAIAAAKKQAAAKGNPNSRAYKAGVIVNRVVIGRVPPRPGTQAPVHGRQGKLNFLETIYGGQKFP